MSEAGIWKYFTNSFCRRVLSNAARVETCEGFRPEYNKVISPVISAGLKMTTMCFTFGQFVEEKYKPAFYDAAVSFVHPVTGLFPHASG